MRILTKKDNKKITNYNLSGALENSNKVSLPNMTEILQHLNKINDVDNICSFICDKIKEIVGRGYIFATLMKTDGKSLVLKSIKGFEDKRLLNFAIRILDSDPRDMEFLTKDMTESELASFQSGKLEHLPGGVYALLTRRFPKVVCISLEKLLKIHFVYTIGFTCHDNYLGGISILLDSKTVIEKNASIIENMVNQSAIYLSKIHTEDKLRKSEEKYHTLFDTSFEGILITDSETYKFKYANPTICKMLGYTEKELVTMGISAIHPKEDLQSVLAVFQDKVREINPLATDIPCLRKNGTIFYADINMTNIVIDGQKYTTGFFHDITERKKAKDLLRIEHGRLTNILEGTNVGTWEWNVQTGETVFNERWANIIGYTLDEISPAGIETRERFTHPEDLEKSNEQLSKVFAKEIDYYDIECRMKHKDGNWVWVQDRGKVTSWTTDGNPLWMSGTHTDITERKKSEEDLIQNENLLNQVGEISKIGGWEMDMAEGGKAKWTKGTYDIVEISYNEFIPGYIEHTNYYLPKYRKMIKEKMQRLLTKKEALHFQAQVKTAKNNIKWVEAFGEAITENGKVVKLIGTLQDITERKKAEEDLKISYKKTKIILDETIKTLASIIEIRDPYTSGHQQKVAEIATSIAIEMGLDQDRVNGISTAAILHDIGKITVPASILSKPGKISDLEYEMIKTHSETGYNMLKNIDFPWPVAKTILQHHERINGTGYPKGLKAKNILLEAKILAVADVLEAMTSHRPYRPSLGLDQAIKELEENKGILYDSEVVDICNKLIKSGVMDFHGDQQN
jgi:PAS domain S-box/PAS domain S-box/PAS domain S-box/uncharacterized domain HDIG